MTNLCWYSAEDVAEFKKEFGILVSPDARERFLFRDAAGRYSGIAGDERWMRFDGDTWTATDQPRESLEGLALWGSASARFAAPARSTETEAPRPADAFAVVVEAVRGIAEAYGRGEITSEQAESLAADVLILDRDGVVWTVGLAGGGWYRFADESWQPVDGPPDPDGLAITGDLPVGCPNCGALTDGARFCPSCGTKLPQHGVPHTPELATYLASGIGTTPEPVTPLWEPPPGLPAAEEAAAPAEEPPIAEAQPEEPPIVEAQPEEEEQPVAFCPNCGAPALEGASFCAACGKRLPGVVAPRGHGPAPIPEATARPERTGTKIYTANPAKAPAPVEVPPRDGEGRRSRAWIAAALVVLVVAGAAVGWWFFLRDEGSRAQPRSGLTNTCTSAAPAFTVEYPRGWSASAGPDLDCRFFHPKPFQLVEGTDAFALAVSIQPRQGRYEAVLNGATDPSLVRVLSSEDATIGGRWPGVLLEVQVTDPGIFPRGTRLYGYIAEVAGRAWIIQTIDWEDLDYNTNKAVVDRMASSIEIP